MDFSQKAKRGILKIFSGKIEQAIFINEATAKLKKFLPEDIISNVTEMSKTNHIEAVEKLLETLTTSSLNSDDLWFRELVNVIAVRNPDLASRILCKNIHDSVHYAELMEHVVDMNLCDTLKAESQVVFLEKDGLFDKDFGKLLSVIDSRRANCLMLQELPKRNTDWYSKFIDSLGNCSLTEIRDQIVPDRREEVSTPSTTNGKVAGFSFVPTTSEICSGDRGFSLDKNTMAYKNHQEKFRPIVRNKQSDSAIKNYTSSKRKPVETLTLRSYQNELIPRALEGQNIIALAPTGSGKTFLAIELILRHLEKPDAKKVVFFVPTVDLVDQQSNVLKRYLPHNYRLIALRGSVQKSDTEIPKAQAVYSHDVIVMTPMILINILDGMNIDRTSIPISLQDFSLFVFDECHHTIKGHPYNTIMIRYLDALKQNKENGASNSLPQIVGMTASLGVDKAKSPMGAREAILDICSRLDCQYLETIRNNLEELEHHVNVPRDELVRVPSANMKHAFAVHVQEMMVKIEQSLCPVLDQLTQLKEWNIKPPERRWLPIYTNYVSNLIRNAPIVHDDVKKTLIMKYIKFLKVYHMSLILNSHVPTSYALNYLHGEVQQLGNSRICEENDEVLEHYNRKHGFLKMATEQTSSALVTKLKDILVNEYKDRSNCRTIIFVQTRELTVALSDYLLAEPTLTHLNAARLVGGTKSDKGAQADKVQKQVLENFRNGTHKVVVATTVAEEGLDIQDCNLVIKYNHVTNETAMIQRRGRGRAENSRSILLAQDGWIADKEITNMFRETLMRNAITAITSAGQSWFREQVEARQVNEKKNRDIEKNMRDTKKQRLGDKVYDLVCNSCPTVICRSNDIRVVNDSAYVAIDTSVWSKLQVYEKVDPQMFDSMAVVGKIACHTCNEIKGAAIKYQNAYLPSIKMETVTLCDVQTGTRTKPVRKWSLVREEYFDVPRIHVRDWTKMIKALQNPAEKLDKVIEEYHENMRALREEEEKMEEAERNQKNGQVETQMEQSSSSAPHSEVTPKSLASKLLDVEVDLITF